MKYLLTVELTKEELMSMDESLWLDATRSEPFRKLRSEVQIILKTMGFTRCRSCGNRWSSENPPRDWYSVCPPCYDRRVDLIAISRAVDRDREATTGENSPAEDLV